MKLSLVSIPVQDPLAAHEIYTSTLGFQSKEFKPEESLAIIVSAEDPNGTAILLEPCKGSFAEDFQKSAFEANLPYMIFAVNNVEAEVARLQAAGVQVRLDLDRPEWGLSNMFEDGCGNLLMLEEMPAE